MITIQHVSKLYRLYRRPIDRLLDSLPFPASPRYSDFYALRDINFSVSPGEIFSIVGPNGSGKSTLLQIIAGILPPTTGRVLTSGRVSALLELGAGFNPEFTGRENVFLSGEILGISRPAMERAFPAIQSFADIGPYIDRPVKEYSSGMYVRLAFSTAIHVDPEILIVDEALSVGDAIFSARCIQKFEELKARKVTILFVSHDLGLVKRLSDRAAFLLHGRIQALGSPNDVVNRYVGLVHQSEPVSPATTDSSLPASFRHGDGASRIESIQLLNRHLAPTSAIQRGEPATIRITARFHQPADNPVFGLLIRNRLGIDVYGTNSKIENISTGQFRPGDLVELDFTFDCWLARHDYTITVAVQHNNGASQDWLDDALSFSVVDPKPVAGVVDLKAGIAWRKL